MLFFLKRIQKKMKEKNIYLTFSVTLFLILCNYIYNLITVFILDSSEHLPLEYNRIINFLIDLLGMVGIIIFVVSNFTKSSLLRFFFCIEIFSFPISIHYYYKIFTYQLDIGDHKFPINSTHYLYFALSLITMCIAVLGLLHLKKKRTLLLKHYSIDSETIAEFSPAPSGIRFANRFIDLLVIYLTIFRFYKYFFKENDWADNPYLLVLIELFVFLYYYLLLEIIFKTTAGKCLTNSIIVNASASSPSIGQLIGRTFCRLIPFDAFSFLTKNKRGWHDIITETYVCQSIHKDENEV